MSKVETPDERLEKIRAEKEMITALVTSDGWKHIEDYFKAVRVGRRNAIFGADVGGMDSLIKMGQLQSELAGIEFVLATPQALIDELDIEEKALLEDIRDELVD